MIFSDDLWQGVGYFVAGGIAGVVSRTATAPFDRLKVYLIASTDTSHKEVIDAAKSVDIAKTARKIGRPFRQAISSIWRDGGVRSFFVGNGLNVIKVLPESAIKFGSYEASKRALARIEGKGDVDSISPLSKFLAGGVGGVVSQAAIFPIDTLKL